MEREKNYSFLIYIIIAIPIILLVIVFIGISSHFNQEINDDKGVEVSLTEKYIHLKGVITQDSIKIDNIKNIRLCKQLIKGSKEGGGIQNNDYANGDVRVAELGMTRAYAYTDIPMYIRIDGNQTIYILNQPTEEQTLSLYNKLLEKAQKVD